MAFPFLPSHGRSTSRPVLFRPTRQEL